ncbi:MAG: hypothetical protein SPL13_03445, partial [Clostridia bacterium]|nr:hypothetical protein [Clostridia bacterium]
PTDEGDALGIKGLSLCFMGDAVTLLYNTYDNLPAPNEIYSSFISSSTAKTTIEIEEASNGFKMSFKNADGELLDPDEGVQTVLSSSFNTSITFNDIVDANGYTHMSISSPSSSTNAFTFTFDEDVTVCNTPILYDDNSAFDGTIEVKRATLANGRAINVNEAGFSYDAAKGYNVRSYVSSLTVSDGMTEVTVTPGQPLVFRKLSYRYTNIATAIGSLTFTSDPGTQQVPWSYGDTVGGSYAGDTTNGVSMDFGFTLDSLSVTEGYTQYGNPHFCICIGPNTEVLWPGNVTSNKNVFVLWFTVANNYLYVDFYDNGNSGSGWTQRAQNQGFSEKFSTSVGAETRFTINIVPVDGVWDIYFASLGEEGIGDKIDYSYDPSFNFNSKFGANFMNAGGCNIAMYGFGAQGTLALYTYRTEINVTAPMRFKSSKNAINAKFTAAYDEYGAEIPLFSKEITSTGFKYVVAKEDVDKLAFVNFVTAGGISRTVSAFATKVIFDDGVNIELSAKVFGDSSIKMSLYPEEVRIFNNLTKEEMSTGLTINSYQVTDTDSMQKYASSFYNNSEVKGQLSKLQNVVVVSNIAKKLPIIIALAKDVYTDEALSDVTVNGETLQAYVAEEGLEVDLVYVANFYNKVAGGTWSDPRIKNFDAGISVRVNNGGAIEYITEPDKLVLSLNNGVVPTYDSANNKFVFTGLIQKIKVTIQISGCSTKTVYVDENSANPVIVNVDAIDLTNLTAYINEVKELKDSCYVSSQDGKDVAPTSSWCTEATAAKLNAAIEKAEQTPVYDEADIKVIQKDLQRSVVEFYQGVQEGTYGMGVVDVGGGTAATSSYIACKTAIGMEIYLAPVLIGVALFIVIRRLRKSDEEK